MRHDADAGGIIGEPARGGAGGPAGDDLACPRSRIDGQKGPAAAQGDVDLAGAVLDQTAGLVAALQLDAAGLLEPG